MLRKRFWSANGTMAMVTRGAASDIHRVAHCLAQCQRSPFVPRRIECGIVAQRAARGGNETFVTRTPRNTLRTADLFSKTVRAAPEACREGGVGEFQQKTCKRLQRAGHFVSIAHRLLNGQCFLNLRLRASDIATVVGPGPRLPLPAQEVTPSWHPHPADALAQ